MPDNIAPIPPANADVTPPPQPDYAAVESGSDIKRIAEAFKKNYQPVSKSSPNAKDPVPQMNTDGTQPAKPAPDAVPKPDDGTTSTPKPGTFAHEQWKKLELSRDSFKDQHEKATAKLKEYETELEKLRKGAPDERVGALTKEVERLKAAETELNERLEAVNFERSPRFQAWWQGETGKHLAVAKRYVPADKQGELEQLLMAKPGAARDQALSDLVEPLSSVAKGMILNSATALEAAKVTYEEAVQKGSEQWKRLKEAEKVDQLATTQRAQAEASKRAEAALARARTLDAFQPKDGDPEHNERVKQSEALVSAFFANQLDDGDREIVPIAAAAHLYDTKVTIPALKARAEKAEALLAELQKASPSVKDAAAPGTVPSTPPGEPGNEFAAAYRKLMKR